jgi:hypothetical protein
VTVPKKGDKAGDAVDDSWPWVIKLTGGTGMPDARALIERAGREQKRVVIKVVKQSADHADLVTLMSDALERDVPISIETETESE